MVRTGPSNALGLLLDELAAVDGSLTAADGPGTARVRSARAAEERHAAALAAAVEKAATDAQAAAATAHHPLPGTNQRTKFHYGGTPAFNPKHVTLFVDMLQAKAALTQPSSKMPFRITSLTGCNCRAHVLTALLDAYEPVVCEQLRVLKQQGYTTTL